MRIKVLIGALVIYGAGFAQQLPQYSQYHRNQIMANPGAAGSYDFLDLTIGGRYQWAGFDNAPMTAYAYGSSVINKPKVRYNPSLRTSNGPVRNPKVSTGRVKHALGGEFYLDEYGAFRKLSFSGIYAIHLPVTRSSNLSLGTKLGLTNNAFLADRAVVLTQMNGYDGAPMEDDVYNQFLLDQSSLNFMNIGLGLYYYSDQFFLGVSADQLSRDFVSFGSGTANFDPNIHTQLIAGYKFPISENVTLMPSFIGKYMAPAPFSFDVNMQFEYKEWLWIMAGYRNSNDLIIGLGANLNERFKFGYSFDFTTEKIGSYTNGSHEIVMGLMIGR
jgi:type IX secretion system PorP/SprF family membrane protein